eukprot:15232-Heterococcus_DN1.PRE.1
MLLRMHEHLDVCTVGSTDSTTNSECQLSLAVSVDAQAQTYCVKKDLGLMFTVRTALAYDALVYELDLLHNCTLPALTSSQQQDLRVQACHKQR